MCVFEIWMIGLADLAGSIAELQQQPSQGQTNEYQTMLSMQSSQLPPTTTLPTLYQQSQQMPKFIEQSSYSSMGGIGGGGGGNALDSPKSMGMAPLSIMGGDASSRMLLPEGYDICFCFFVFFLGGFGFAL